MPVTQTQFEHELKEALSAKGFVYTLRDVRDLLEIIADTVATCLKQDMREVAKSGWGKASKASTNGGQKKPSNPSVRVRGLGIFRVNWRPAGWGRNPGTGERIKTKASKRLKALPLKALKDEVGVK